MSSAIAARHASTFAAVTGLLCLSCLFVCYCIAVHYDHVKAWLPDVTSCVMKHPESVLFRIVILPTSPALALIWILTLDWLIAESRKIGIEQKRALTWALGISGPAAAAFLALSCSLLNETASLSWSTFIGFMSFFFIFSGISMLGSLLRIRTLHRFDSGICSEKSLRCKTILVSTNIVLQIPRLALVLSQGAEETVPQIPAALDWILIFTCIGYILNLAFDWRGKLVLITGLQFTPYRYGSDSVGSVIQPNSSSTASGALAAGLYGSSGIINGYSEEAFIGGLGINNSDPENPENHYRPSNDVVPIHPGAKREELAAGGSFGSQPGMRLIKTRNGDMLVASYSAASSAPPPPMDASQSLLS